VGNAEKRAHPTWLTIHAINALENMYKDKAELRLKKLSLDNFRGFDKLELVLQPELTVLIGKNGTGKTAILESISKLLTVFENKIRNHPDPNKDLKTAFDASDIKKGAVQSIIMLCK